MSATEQRCPRLLASKLALCFSSVRFMLHHPWIDVYDLGMAGAREFVFHTIQHEIVKLKLIKPNDTKSLKYRKNTLSYSETEVRNKNK